MYQIKKVWKMALVSLLFYSGYASAVDVRFSGFGDVVYGANAGDPADAQAAALFELYGDDPYPVNSQKGFAITGTDFVVIADFSDNMRFLSEINLQAARGQSSEFELDVERMLVDYSIIPEFNVQAGLYFTPIGYFNRFLYSRAWLMNSVQIPDLFEEELNLVPTHTIGVVAYGTHVLDNGHSANYAFSVGNGRAPAPDMAIYARDSSSAKEIAGLVEWIMPGVKDSRFGLSAWTDRIDTVLVPTFGSSIAIDTAQQVTLRETGINPFMVLNKGPVSVLAEYVHAEQKDQIGTLNGRSYSMSGVIGEVALHLKGNKVHPYIRYDRTSLPANGGPYYSLREDGAGNAYRVYVPEFKAGMVGVAYDVTVHNRLKIEYIRHFEGSLAKHGIVIQSSYGF